LNKLRKKVMLVSIIIALIVLVAGAFLVLYDNRERLTAKMDSEQIASIEDVFDVDLPEKGEMIFFDDEIFDDELVELCVGIKLNKKDFSFVYEQIKEKYRNSPFLEIDEERFEEFYKLKSDDINSIHYASVLYLNPDVEMKNCIHERYVYISKVEDGVFYLIFET